MRYEEAIEWLYALRRPERRRELRRAGHLLRQLGDPQDAFMSIHVAGTNGKGSTAAMIASILQAAGYRVGLFTSPHLSSFTERIVVDGERISGGDVVGLVEGMRPLAEQMAADASLGGPSFFEAATAMAFRHFADRGVDFAVVEAGIGGRGDATNVIDALVSVITNVSLEHADILGGTVLEIAREKAGIITEGGVLVTATGDDEVYRLLEGECGRAHSRIFRVGRDVRFRRLSADLEGQRFQLDGILYNFEELFIPLLGAHQVVNAATAACAVEALSLRGNPTPREAIAEGLSRVSWPGRLEVVQRRPLVVLDCAKDPEAARALAETLLTDFSYERLIAVVSISSDKDIPAMVGHLARAADLFVVTAHRVMGRAADPLVIAEEVRRRGKPFEVAPDVEAAVRRALELAGGDDLVCVSGSVFLVGEARSLWARPKEPEA